VEVKNLSKEEERNEAHFRDKETGGELEVQEKISLLEWLASNYKKFGCQLEFVSNKSQEGSQFCRGFGGIGGLLRYSVDLTEFEEPDGEGEGAEWNSDEDI
jgi:peptide chain release factor subunit 1